MQFPTDISNGLFKFDHKEVSLYDAPFVDSKTIDILTKPGSRRLYNNSRNATRRTVPKSAIPIPSVVPLPPKRSNSAIPPIDDSDAESNISGSNILENLRTGDDAVKYFATSNGAGPIKFVYCIRERIGDLYRPYNLIIVDQTEAVTAEEYYTVCSNGVVSMAKNQPSEFYTLSEWMKFSTIFRILSTMKFFKYFLSAKNFDSWKNNVRYKLFTSKRKSLSEVLFLSKTSFSPSLLSVKSQLCEMDKVHMQTLSPPLNHKYYDYSMFTEMQTTIRNEAMKQFELLMEKLQLQLEKVCTEVSVKTKLWEKTKVKE